MIVALIVLVLAQGSEHDQIPRREQARGAFLATPEGVYRHYCAHCHGQEGKGNGRLWVTGLTPPPSDLTATRMDTATLSRFVAEGSAAFGRSNLCPPWGRTIPATERERLALYVVALGEHAAPPRQGPSPVEGPSHEGPIPWKLGAILVVEGGVLAWLLRRRRRREEVAP